MPRTKEKNIEGIFKIQVVNIVFTLIFFIIITILLLSIVISLSLTTSGFSNIFKTGLKPLIDSLKK